MFGEFPAQLAGAKRRSHLAMSGRGESEGRQSLPAEDGLDRLSGPTSSSSSPPLPLILVLIIIRVDSYS